MIKKYNLALLPVHAAPLILQLAQRFAPYAFRYQLGKHSLPHLTLRHFLAEETTIKKIWLRACAVSPAGLITLSLNNFSFTTSNNDVFWISLIPDQRDLLHEMHCAVTDVNSIPRKPDYDPHVTLINTRVKDSELMMRNVRESYQPIKDEFKLVLGNCDKVGQMTAILFGDEAN